jgi:hypothetical protein
LTSEIGDQKPAAPHAQDNLVINLVLVLLLVDTEWRVAGSAQANRDAGRKGVGHNY